MSLVRKMKRAARAPRIPLSQEPSSGYMLQSRSAIIAPHRPTLHDKELINRTLARSVDYWMTCTLMALHDEFGFGVVRLQRAYDKICGIASCMQAGTITLTDLTHFVGCNFDEDRYEKLFGKDSKIPIPQAEEQLKQHLPVSLPEGMRKKLIDAANNHNLTLNQYILRVLKDGLAKEGK